MTGVRRILLVEDDSGIRDSLADVLRDEGFDVYTAINGRDGLTRLEGMPAPDVVVLDVMMPVLDGEGFLHGLETHPQFLSLPVVVITAGGRQIQGPNVVACIHKPFELPALLSQLREVIR